MALIKCPECDNLVSSEASFCPKCGFPLNKVDTPVKTKSSKYTEEDIKRMKMEAENYRTRQKSTSTTGAVLLFIGIISLIAGFLFFVLSEDSYDAEIFYVFAIALLIFGGLFLDGGIACLIVSSAAFGKKAENRERAIQEFEANK